MCVFVYTSTYTRPRPRPRPHAHVCVRGTILGHIWKHAAISDMPACTCLKEEKVLTLLHPFFRLQQPTSPKSPDTIYGGLPQKLGSDPQSPRAVPLLPLHRLGREREGPVGEEQLLDSQELPAPSRLPPPVPPDHDVVDSESDVDVGVEVASVTSVGSDAEEEPVSTGQEQHTADVGAEPGACCFSYFLEGHSVIKAGVNHHWGWGGALCCCCVFQPPQQPLCCDPPPCELEWQVRSPQGILPCRSYHKSLPLC